MELAHMTSPDATPSIADVQRRTAALQRRVVAHMHRTVGLVLDAMDRRHEARERAWREALCTKAACRRAGRCRASWCTRLPASLRDRVIAELAKRSVPARGAHRTTP
jgi:hypothetical protein